MGTGSSAPRAAAEPGPSLWDAPGCVPPTQDGRETRGSALSCIYLHENPANLFTNQCAAAEVPVIRADSTPTRSTRDRWLSLGRAWPGGGCRSPCVTGNHARCAKTLHRSAQSSAHPAGLVCWVLAPCHRSPLVGGGVAVVVTDPPQAAGTRESPAALSFPWLSTLTFPFPSISLLPAAARGGGQGGAAADGQPDPFPPPSLYSQPSPPQHSSGTYEYLYLPVCSESLDTIRTLKSARGGCPVRGAPVAPGRQMRVKGRAWSIRGEDRGHQPPGFLKFGLKKAQRSLLSCAGHQISRARERRCCVAIALPPCRRCTAAAQSPGEIPLPPAAPSPEPWPHPDAS